MKTSNESQPSREERTEVLVFADGPEWDELNGRKWWNVRSPRLLERIGVLDSRFDDGIRQIRDIYPDAVLIY